MANPTPVSYNAASGVIRGGAWNHALAQFARTLAPGQCLEFPAPGLRTADSSGATPFGQPQSAIDAAIAMGYSALPVLDWASMWDFDPRTQRFYVRGGREWQVKETEKLIWYDAKTDTWDSISNWCNAEAGHIYRGTTIANQHGKVLAWNLGSGSHVWDITTSTYEGPLPALSSTFGGKSASWASVKSIVWHPTMGAQGSLIFINQSFSRVARLDWATQTWTPLGTYNSLWASQNIVGHYHPLTRAVIGGHSFASTPSSLVICEADGTARLSAPAPCEISCGGTQNGPFLPHPKRRTSVCFCYITKRIWLYEWDQDNWFNYGPIPAQFNTDNKIGGVVEGCFFLVTRGADHRAYLYKPDF